MAYDKKQIAYIAAWGVSTTDFENLLYKWYTTIKVMDHPMGRSFREYMRKLGYKFNPAISPVRYAIKE